jgi:alpha-L-fucosidase 2
LDNFLPEEFIWVHHHANLIDGKKEVIDRENTSVLVHLTIPEVEFQEIKIYYYEKYRSGNINLLHDNYLNPYHMRYRNPIFTTVFIISILLFINVGKAQTREKDILWYDQPAKSWMAEALPIGNGYMGAMIYGLVGEEHIQFNEESLWTGGKGEWDEYNGGNREQAYMYLPKIRKLLDKGDFKGAHELANRELTGILKSVKGDHIWEGFGAFQTFGDLFVKAAHGDEIKDYRRDLNISDAIASVRYKVHNVEYRREYYASYPKRVLVFRFQNNSLNGIDYEIRLESIHRNVNISFEDDQLVMAGKLENNGMEFESRILIDSDGSEISFSNGKLHVKSAKTLTLYLTAATDYQNVYPNYKGRDYKKLNHKTIAAIDPKKYSEIYKEHQKDYSALYSRVYINLGEQGNNHKSTLERLKAYSDGSKDPSLEALYFQYGRYLMISSSRPGSLPANLQGKWNNLTAPAWASDYHANINIQMIYWPAEITNLSECAEPLMDYIDKLREPGRKSAKDFFNARGWIVNTANNIFGYTAPGWEFPWGFFPGGAAWYGRHIWDHYEYTGDIEFLRKEGYPIMKESALFWLDYLTEDENGFLISSPSYSPEHGGISTGAYMDIQIAWDIFTNCIKASELLGDDEVFKNELIKAKNKLLPLQIGNWGQLQEWKEDVDNPNSKHRHVSHLYALYPGDQIMPLETTDFAKAAKISLDARGDDGTGWSIAWKINFWARLFDGNHAYTLLRRAMKWIVTVEEIYDEGVGGVYSNLLSGHPPFQLDGNMGTTAGIAEMLLQSHTNQIHILPALPDAWDNGKIMGLKARGGFEIDIEWTAGKLEKITIESVKGGDCKLRYRDKEIYISLKAGDIMMLNNELHIL